MFKLTLFLSCLVGSGAGGRKRGVPGGDPPKFINATPINPSMLLNNWDMTTKYVISMINTLHFKISLLMLKKVKKAKSLSRVRLCNPMGCSLLGSSIHGTSQARVLEWVAISFSRGSFWPRDQTQVPSCIAGRHHHLNHQGNQGLADVKD